MRYSLLVIRYSLLLSPHGKDIFYGGVGTVTGSKYLIEHADKRSSWTAVYFRVIKNCGTQLARAAVRPRYVGCGDNHPRAHRPHRISYPSSDLGFKGPVFTSRATNDLLKICSLIRGEYRKKMPITETERV